MNVRKLAASAALFSVLLFAGPTLAYADDGALAQSAQANMAATGVTTVTQTNEGIPTADGFSAADGILAVDVATPVAPLDAEEAELAKAPEASIDASAAASDDNALDVSAPASVSHDAIADGEANAEDMFAPADENAGEIDAASAAKGSDESANASEGDVEATRALLASNAQDAHTASISYRAHVENIGWQDWCSDGDTAGTSGLAYRMEALEFKVESDLDGAVYCQAHVQDIGWQRQQEAQVDGGSASVGTTSKAYRVEAMKLTLSGELSQWYDIEYRVHVENEGWMAWKKNGALAGTTGKGLRIEALELHLVEKSSAPAASPTDGTPGLVYRAHVENVGWQDQKASSQTAGTTGKALQVEALEIWLDDAAYEGSIAYRAHVQNLGWLDWVSAGKTAGTTGRALQLEAYQITLSGNIADCYDIVYRAHVENIGWQSWVVNGGTAGTEGKGLQVEALQVKLVRKGPYSVSEGTYMISAATDASLVLSDVGSSSAVGSQIQMEANQGNQAEKFYLRKEGSGLYSLQSVASGLFLADQAGKVVQAADVDDENHRWKMSWNGGVILTNVGTGKVLSLTTENPSAGAKAISQTDGNKTSQRWMLANAQLIADGYYEIGSRLGTYVDVAYAAYADGANVQAHERNGSAAQKFHIYLKNGSYVIENCKSFSVLDVDGKSTANGANVMQCTWNGGDNQRWTAEIDREGYIVLISKNSGKVLEIAGGSSSSGANIQQNARNDSPGQQWKLVSTERYSLSGSEYLDRIVATVLKTHTTLKSAFNYVSYGYTYRAGNKHWSGWALSDATTVAYAEEMYTYGSGNCYRFACLFAWLARGLGYTDVIVRSGWVVGYSAPQAPHGWVVINGYVCDPDMQSEAPSRDWFWQTYDSAPTAYYSW